MNDKYNIIIDEYEKFAKNLILYDTFSSGFLFNNITEEKMEENVFGTYKNICHYGFDSDDHIEFIEKVDNYIRKIIKLFNEEDVSYFLDEIKEKYINYKKRNFYIAFCFLAECIQLLARTGNMLYKFLINISEFDFKSVIKNDNSFLEGCIFVQRMLKLMKEVIFLHWKRIKTTRLLI